MASLNRVMLIGRLTRDAEVRDFETGGRMASFTVAVDNPRKNQQTGEWEKEPAFIDAKLFKRGEYDRVQFFASRVLKGNQVYVEGHLRQEKWPSREDPSVMRSKLVLYVDNFEILESPRAQTDSYGAQTDPYGSDYAPPATGYQTDASPSYSESSVIDVPPPPPAPGAEPTTYGGEDPKEERIPF